MLCDCVDGVMSTKVRSSTIHKFVLFLKKHEKGFYMSHQYVLTMCTWFRAASPPSDTHTGPAAAANLLSHHKVQLVEPNKVHFVNNNRAAMSAAQRDEDGQAA